MRAFFVMSIAAILVSGCASTQPHTYVLDGQTQDITTADLDAIVSVAHRSAYLYFPIYRVHVVSPTEVEVWYGRRDGDWLDHLIVTRATKTGEWLWTGNGAAQRVPKDLTSR